MSTRNAQPAARSPAYSYYTHCHFGPPYVLTHSYLHGSLVAVPARTLSGLHLQITKTKWLLVRQLARTQSGSSTRPVRYRIAGNFRGYKISRIVPNLNFRGF